MFPWVRSAALGQPPGHHLSDRCVQCHEVGCPGEPLDVGLGDACPQVGQESVMEDRIATAPQEQRGSWVLVEHIGARLQRLVRRVGGGDRDVSDEISHRLAPFGRAVGGTQHAPVLPARHQGGAGHEGRGSSAAQVDQAPRRGDQRWHGHTVGLGNRGVGQDKGVDVE